MSDLILDTARAIGTLLAPLMGARARGKVVAKATAGDVFVPRHAILIPVLDGDKREAGILRVASNPAVERGQEDGWTVTAAGAEIDVTAAFGGVGGSLPAGTVCRWEMPIAGLAPTVQVAAPGTSGGLALDGPGTLRGFHIFEDVGQQDAWKSLMAANASRFPAAVLFWVDSTPADGVASARTERGGVRVGRGRQLYAESWTLHLYTSRTDGDPARRREGLTLLQDAAELLTDRHSVDGIPLSSPSAVTIQRRYRAFHEPRWYCYAIDFTTTHCLTMRDERTWNEWLTTRLDVTAPAPEGSGQPPFPTADGAVIDMRQP